MNTPLFPSAVERAALLSDCTKRLNAFWEILPSRPIGPTLSRGDIGDWLQGYDFAEPRPLAALLPEVIDQIAQGIVHSAHPACFGLFNPSPTFPGVLGELISASFNPQLAVWSHAPIAVEIEKHVVRALAARLGFSSTNERTNVCGHFTTGGAEANATATLLALTRTFPEFSARGTQSLPGRAALYASAESHFAWFKIAHQSGLGREAVRLVATDGTGRMDPAALATAIAEDRKRGFVPFLIVVTAGTTNAGMIDAIGPAADIALREGLWLHVDAAWGGALALVPSQKHFFAEIERADSVTIDAHKWLSAPMGAGILLARDQALLAETFRVTASYMPSQNEAEDPYVTSIQWSRRFIGLKVFLALAAGGWTGLVEAIDHQRAMAALLASRLRSSGWNVLNDSPVGVVVFVDADRVLDLSALVAHIQNEQKVWISVAKFEGQAVVRACVTSFRCESEHVEALINSLERARKLRP